MKLQEIEPVSNKLFDLQKEGKIALYGFNYGLSHSSAYVKIEFEMNSTRERVMRTMTGKDMEEAANNTMELLNLVK